MFVKFLFLILMITPHLAWAGFANYNSILIGERAAGMGGAYTALSGDAAASSFYNPATLARMEGSTLSAAVNIYKKFDTNYGEQKDYADAPLRINRGQIVPVPSSSGSVYSFQNFAFALSIVFPDFDYYTGEIRSTSSGDRSYLSYRDESLWVGGSFAINLTQASSLGFTLYYVSQTYNRSVTDQFEDGSDTINISEEKTVINNALVYMLGYYYNLGNNWSIGTSLRLPSLKVNSEGTYFKTELSTSGVQPTINLEDLDSGNVTPLKASIGIGYDVPNDQAFSLDVSFHDGISYKDLNDSQGSDEFTHEPTYNINIGYETHLKSWLSLRLGVFSNFASTPEIPSSPTKRYGDHIDMWGFSTNFGIKTSDQTTITLGGYYNGGSGYATEQVGGQIERVEKSIQVFSFLVATAFQF